MNVLSHVVASARFAVAVRDVSGAGRPGRGGRVAGRCFDTVTGEAMVGEIDAARRDGDKLGGLVRGGGRTGCRRPYGQPPVTATAGWTPGWPAR